MKKIFFILTIAVFLIACGQTPESNKNTGSKTVVNATNSTNVVQNQNVSNASNQNASNNSIVKKDDPMNPQAKYFNGVGVVTKINMELGSVELDHEEIKDLMPKMIMEFFVKQPEKLKALKLGDKVEFVLEDKAGAEVITEIKKIEK
jgi:Cu/Ag efflux protein CusF